MSEEERVREEFGALGGCFVEGDAEQRRRERRTKRRALAASITMQALVLAAVILLPLFGKTDRIVLAFATPIPPYSPYVAHRQATTVTHPQTQRSVCFSCFTNLRPTVVIRDNRTTGEDTPSPDGPFGETVPADPGGIRIADARRGPPPPPAPVQRPHMVHVTQLDPALLTRRIEPVYPTLARQTHREGRVELHAIIATDGTIQSLQVVSGDILFIESAKAAVLQWRYRPTYLNGQAVEVDTTITVVYTLGH